MREGLRLILNQQPELKVVAEAENGRMAVELASRLSPDVVVMDISMTDMNGMDATRRIIGENPDIKVVALSIHTDQRCVLGMLEAGASGYVLKAASGHELVQAIRAAVRQKTYLSPDVAGTVVGSYVRRHYPLAGSAHSILGNREREVLQLLAEGNSTPDIARKLHISIRTVETHRRNIMKKLDIHNVAMLTKYAIREGLTQLDR